MTIDAILTQSRTHLGIVTVNSISSLEAMLTGLESEETAAPLQPVDHHITAAKSRSCNPTENGWLDPLQAPSRQIFPF